MTTAKSIQNFEGIFQEMQTYGMVLPVKRVYVRIQNAKEILSNAMNYFIGLEGKKAIWLSAYDEVAGWLTDNRGKGLFLSGNCGMGKSILCRYVIPAILLKYCNKVVFVFDVQNINKDIDHVLSKHLITLDDIGTEEISVKFGEKRMAFAEIIDAAEKFGKLLIVSTNLSGNQIKERYGDRIVDRIHSTMTQVMFNGKSLRK